MLNTQQQIKKLLSLLVLTSWIWATLTAQSTYTISGIVQNQQQEILPLATIYITTDTASQQIMVFSTSDNNGNFSLTVADSIYPIVLHTNYLGYEPLHSLIRTQQDTFVSIQLLPQEQQLPDIVVKEQKMPINDFGDTLVYNLSQFRDSTEYNIEEVLKKLPGFEVATDGEISVAGKSIKKMLIEGTDMFGKQYTIGSKNIRADFIESVEVIDHYEEDRLQKNIRYSDDLVINLKLSEQAKRVLSGVVTGGMGDGQAITYKGNANIFSIGKTNKIILLSDIGNTGTQYSPEELKVSYAESDAPIDLEQAILLETAPITPSEIQTLDIEPLSLIDNAKRSFSTIRSHFDITPNTKVTVNGYFHDKKDGQQSKQKQTYLFNQQLFELSQQNNISINHRASGATIDLQHFNKQLTTSFDGLISISNTHSSSQENTLFNKKNTSFFNKKLTTNNLLLAGKYQFKIKKTSLLAISLKHQTVKTPQSTKSYHDNYAIFFEQPTLQFLHQTINNQKKATELSSQYFGRFNQWLVQTKTTFKYSKIDAITEQQAYKQLSLNKIELQYHSDDIVQNLFNGQVSISRNWSNKWFWSTYMEGFLSNTSTQHIEYKPKWHNNISVGSTLNLDLKQQRKLRFSYFSRKEVLGVEDFYHNSYFMEQFSIIQNTPKDKTPQSHQLTFRYAKQNTSKLNSYYVSSSVAWNVNTWLNQLQLLPTFVITEPYFSKHNFRWTTHGKVDAFWSKIKTNIQVYPYFTWNKYDFKVNNVSAINEEKQTSFRLNLSTTWHRHWKTTFDNTFTYSWFTMSNIYNSAIISNHLKAYLTFQKGNYRATYTHFWHTYQQRDFFSMTGGNLNIVTQLPNFGNNSSLKVSAYNIYNKKSYELINNDELFFNQYQTDLIPFFFLLEFETSF